MAAPTIPASQQSTSLNKLLSKESGTKLSHKNILVAEYEEWPRPKKSVEDSILAKLEEKLKTLPNVFKSSKESQKGDNVGSDKAKVRSQLEIGTSSVFRALEQDALACVLVSGQATPAIAVEHIISLGKERGCPLLCFDQLAPTVAKATETKCHPLAVGFKKLADDSQSDFKEIISLVKENTHVIGPQYGRTAVKDVADENKRKNGEGTNIQENGFRPLRVAADVEKEILQELERVFVGMKAVTEDKGKGKRKKKKKKQKKNLKDAFDKSYHPLFEIGKRTVTDILERGKLQLILISKKISPVLVCEPQSFSLLSVAKERQCPVLVVPCLDDTMRMICGGCVNVLGFKKVSCLPENSPKDFAPLTKKCLEAVKNLGDTIQSVEERSHPPSGSITGPEQRKPQIEPTQTSTLQSSIRGKDMATEDEEDYSYLYILKQDSKAYADMKSNFIAEAESTAKSANFAADFIAFSTDIKGKPSSQPVTKEAVNVNELPKSSDMKGKNSQSMAMSSVKIAPDTSEEISLTSAAARSQNTSSALLPNQNNSKDSAPSAQLSMAPDNTCSSSTIPLFSISRSGISFKQKKEDDKSSSKQTKTSETVETTSNVLGISELPKSSTVKATGIDVLAFMDPGKNAKKALKRKMDIDSDFISFKYTEANIKTMTSNPSRKKKKKRNK